jgi:hypothetical protein
VEGADEIARRKAGKACSDTETDESHH